MKKFFLIVFMTIFLVLNVKAENNVEYTIRYYYDVNGTPYVVKIKIDNLTNNVSFGRDAVSVSKMDENGGSVENIVIKGITDVSEGSVKVGIDDFWYIISDYVENNKELTYEQMYDEFINNPELYKPMLFFDKDGNAYVVGPYIVNYDNLIYSDTGELIFPDPNINNCDDKNLINMLLNGEFNNEAFLDYYHINTTISIEYTRFSKDSHDILDANLNNNQNTSYTAGTCEGYSVQLRTFREKIIGNGNTKGVCSNESLNVMQSYASLWELEKNFDKSILEKECQETVYNYIDTIINATQFYIDNHKTNTKISCLYMQSEYLTGLSILTSYTSYVENADKSGCELIGKDLIDFINDLFDIVKIISLCVCIFLCILDVYKIAITKEDDISKFKNVLIKRVIALVVLFLVPLIVNIITDLINDRYLKNNPSKCSNVIRK